jgi:hypothetical protein
MAASLPSSADIYLAVIPGMRRELNGDAAVMTHSHHGMIASAAGTPGDAKD